jgi:hypothetical protein
LGKKVGRGVAAGSPARRLTMEGVARGQKGTLRARLTKERGEKLNRLLVLRMGRARKVMGRKEMKSVHHKG